MEMSTKKKLGVGSVLSVFGGIGVTLAVVGLIERRRE